MSSFPINQAVWMLLFMTFLPLFSLKVHEDSYRIFFFSVSELLNFKELANFLLVFFII